MNDPNMYDRFSINYDRFVNWDARLSTEIPFLVSELAVLQPKDDGTISILDAACGTGRHVIALEDQGFDCAGADLSAEMVSIAQQNALGANYDIEFKQAGFGELTDAFGEDSFDGLICLGNSLPHVLDEGYLANTFEDFKSVMRKGSKLIIQNRNFDKVMAERSRWMPPQTYREGERTWIFARFYDFDPDGRLTFNILIFDSQAGEDFQQEVVSTRLWPMGKGLLAEYLESAGFTDLKFYGDLAGSDFVIDDSPNLVLTARRR